jgi:hypothetical protein
MRHFLSIISIAIFLSGCGGFSLDGAEEHMIEDCKCEGFTDVSDGLFIEEKQGSVQVCARKIGDSLKYGFVIDNDKCEPFLPFIYDNARDFNCGLAPVQKNNLWGVIDTTGKVVIDYKFKDLQSFSDCLAAFSDNFRWGFITSKGDTIVSAKYDNVTDFWADISFVHNGQQGWKIINSKGAFLQIRIDSLVENYHFNGGMLALGKGKSGNEEYLDYPFYSNGQKVKIFISNKKYAVVPYDMEFKFTTLSDTASQSILVHQLFNNNR